MWGEGLAGALYEVITYSLSFFGGGDMIGN